MIKVGDTVKIVRCNLCGKICYPFEGTFGVIKINFKNKESFHKVSIRSTDGTLEGSSCITNLRKIK